MTTLRFSGRRRIGVLALAALLPAAACQLDVPQPDIVAPGQLTSKEALPTLLNGSAYDFAAAFSGNDVDEGAVLLGGLFADEYVNSDYFLQHREIDTRSISEQNAMITDLFRNLQRARTSSEFTAAQYASLDPGAEGHAEVLSFAGYSYLLLAEDFCSGVAFSSIDGTGKIAYGEPQTTAQVYQTAADRFDAAITAAQDAGSTDLRYLAEVGLGRVLLDQGNFAAAAAAVADVPLDWRYIVAHAATRSSEYNGVYMWANYYGRFSSADQEGGNGLPFFTSGDPRSPIEDSGDLGLDNFTEFLYTDKYPTRSAPIILASGIEAKLIEAEAELQAGNYGAVTDTLNMLRADAVNPAGGGLTGLAPLPTATTRAEAVQQLFTERAYWLYLTGHRMGDLRRLVRQYGFTEDQVFPTGDYPKGNKYSSEVTFPIPFAERNNPNFHGCIDRDA